MDVDFCIEIAEDAPTVLHTRQFRPPFHKGRGVREGREGEGGDLVEESSQKMGKEEDEGQGREKFAPTVRGDGRICLQGVQKCLVGIFSFLQ